MGSAGWDPRCPAPGSVPACGVNAAFVESQLGRFAVAVLGTGIWENRELPGPGYLESSNWRALGCGSSGVGGSVRCRWDWDGAAVSV